MALLKDRNTPMRDGMFQRFPVKGGVHIFAGALLVHVGGFAQPGTTATGLTTIGRADHAVDNTLGQDGDVFVTVRRKGLFLFDNLATDMVGSAQIGQPCYVVDDATVAATNGGTAAVAAVAATANSPAVAAVAATPANRSVAGLVADVDDSGVWVKFS